MKRIKFLQPNALPVAQRLYKTAPSNRGRGVSGMKGSENRSVYRDEAEINEENKKLRRLQMMMSMVMAVLSQDPNLTMEEASNMIANSKQAALAMFPDKELAYDLIYRPRLQRVLNERFRIQ